ncbi:hypothetical protein QAD02_017300 [Eretmocerus hayati]|uniref:Uncharacterized protein n=1 Tax=Eretmocerus hayati TaxID=131215 RepID=A0ACC2PEL7_9HYME|nr:hypothetical protein QAD02_017300 [Eretmocerus hayati]
MTIDTPDEKSIAHDNEGFEIPKSKHNRKKRRMDSATPMPEEEVLSILLKAKERVEGEGNTQPLKFQKFEQFMIDSRGSKNIIELAASFTDNIQDLTTMIDTFYPHIDNPVMKARCTKIKKKLEQNEKNGIDTELDTSSRSDQESA